MIDMEKIKETEQYRKKIIELVKKINNQEFLKKIYYFVKVFLEE